MKKNFIIGFICGGLIFGVGGAFAANVYNAYENPYPVKVNGEQVHLEGYNINDNTYFKLRDVADAIGGLRVDFVDNTITLTKISPTPAPINSPTPMPIKQLSELKEGEAVDGIKTEYIEWGYYVKQTDILKKYKGLYDFSLDVNGKWSVGKIVDGKLQIVFDDIPHAEHILAVDLNWYNTVLQPWLASEGWQ